METAQKISPGASVTGLMLHVPGKILDEVLAGLKNLDEPAASGVRKMVGVDFYDVSFRCDSKTARDLIPKLKRAGCEGIVEYPVSKAFP